MIAKMENGGYLIEPVRVIPERKCPDLSKLDLESKINRLIHGCESCSSLFNCINAVERLEGGIGCDGGSNQN